MVDIHHTAIAEVPVDVGFGYVDDYRNVPKWMFGCNKFEPVGELDHGLGAVFDTAMQLGPTTLRSTVKIIEWELDKTIVLDSIKGFVNRSSWRFAALDGDRSELTVDFHYELPGGLAGKALGKIIEPFVSIAIKHTEQTLRTNIERRHAEGRR